MRSLTYLRHVFLLKKHFIVLSISDYTTSWSMSLTHYTNAITLFIQFWRFLGIILLRIYGIALKLQTQLTTPLERNWLSGPLHMCSRHILLSWENSPNCHWSQDGLFTKSINGGFYNSVKKPRNKQNGILQNEWEGKKARCHKTQPKTLY